MAKPHSIRGRPARRRPINASKPRPKILATTTDERPDFDEILGRFSEALAIAEAAHVALDAAQECDGHIGPGVLTLQRGIDELKRIYNELDLAILELA